MKVILIVVAIWVTNIGASPGKEDTRGFFDDHFTDHTKVKTLNLTKGGKKIHHDDLMVPSYECQDRGNETMELQSWHHSCRSSCVSNKEAKRIPITLLEWESKIKEVVMYKVVPSKVCYVSHVNIWGHCSQTQFISPHKLEADDILNARKIVDENQHNELSDLYLRNSKIAGCSYWSDVRSCGMDMKMIPIIAYLYRGKTDEDFMIVSQEHGIKAPFRSGEILLQDTAYIWNSTLDKDHICVWRVIGTTTCQLVKQARVLRCPDIGYNYDIATMRRKEYCGTLVYAGESAIPFMISEGEVTNDVPRNTIFEKAKEGKEEKEVNLIKEINRALTDIEVAYCESICDITMRTAKDSDDQVLMTPIGHWLYIKENRNKGVSEHLSICKLTSDWVISTPFSMCGFSPYVTVRSKTRKDVAVWDIRTDHIRPNVTCSDIIDHKVEHTLKSAYKKKLPYEVTAWNGDKIMSEYPYKNIVVEKPKRVNTHKVSAWSSHVKLDETDLITSDDIGAGIKTVMNETEVELQGTQVNEGIVSSFLGELTTGTVALASWAEDEIFSLLGPIRKIIMLTLCIAVIIATIILSMRVMNIRGKKKVKEVYRSVRFSEAPIELDSAPSVIMKRQDKRTIHDILVNQ
ncbi:glycoprotein [alfalfa-associated nucleorhabdovirus]|uniref:Glycoprotein n=1 Tax=alfalfa-associated nucleorhabdovirus TaxID=2518374 RepID=A0A410HY56_9RHAB|nr:glycoprotein [alfalfa-associated nucleorhabdovirus]QAB45075.1 glycoprotein [alfalfa-associated nucleorhabdovirus]UBX89819.1 glycoprotein [alfalfa-associated nucleorhabdovirus]